MQDKNIVGSIGTLCGWKIIVVPTLVYRARRIARRTWRERLFSCPWRPLVSRKIVVVNAPCHGHYLINGDTLICHPFRYEKLKSKLRKLEDCNANE